MAVSVELTQIVAQVAGNSRDIDRLFSLLGWQQAFILGVVGLIGYLNYRGAKNEIRKKVDEASKEANKKTGEYLDEVLSKKFQYWEFVQNKLAANTYKAFANTLSEEPHRALEVQFQAIDALFKCCKSDSKYAMDLNAAIEVACIMAKKNKDTKKSMMKDRPQWAQFIENVIPILLEDSNCSLAGRKFKDIWDSQSI